MADGAGLRGRRASYEPATADARDHVRARRDESHAFFGTDQKLPPVRIAFTGEEFGIGYHATGALCKEAKKKERNGRLLDAGLSTVVHGRSHHPGMNGGGSLKRYDFDRPHFQPLRTREQALFAIKNKDADVAIVPFYQPGVGYDLDTLKALSNQIGMLATEKVEAEDIFCLAVYEPQVLDLTQSAHPGSGFSELQKHSRRSWDAERVQSFDPRFASSAGADYSAGLQIDAAGQLMLRERIDVVYASPEASNRCKSKLDGLRAVGVEVRQLPSSIEPLREMARIAREVLDTNRQTHTSYDPVTGRTTFHSTMTAHTQNAKLFGVVVPFEVALRSPNFLIIEPNIEDSDPPKTRFLAVRSMIDPSLFRAHGLAAFFVHHETRRARQWMKRLQAVAHTFAPKVFNSWDIATGILGSALWFIGAALVALGVIAGVSDLDARLLTLVGVSAPTVAGLWSIALGAIAFVAGSLTLQGRSLNDCGVRVMFRFTRDHEAASIGDVQDFLRRHGVRHSVVQPIDDAEAANPSPVILDVEFSSRDFRNPIPIGNDSVVAQTLRCAFKEWKKRYPGVIAAVPFEDHQLPKAARRDAAVVTSLLVEWVTGRVAIAATYVLAIAVVALPVTAMLFPEVWTQLLNSYFQMLGGFRPS